MNIGNLMRAAARLGARISDAERDCAEIAKEQRERGVWGGAPAGSSLDASVRMARSYRRVIAAKKQLENLIELAKKEIK